MPGIPLVARETIYSRSADQMCRNDSRVHLSAEEEIAAEESLSIYCKPVELYNILQRRAVGNIPDFPKTNILAMDNLDNWPSFLQRCLRYKVQAKHKRRIQMTISLPGSTYEGVENQSPFPLYILLARPISDISVAEYPAVYRFNRTCILTNSTRAEGSYQTQANFILPDINKLAMEAKSGSLTMLLVKCADTNDSMGQFGLSKDIIMDMTSFPTNVGRHCLWGKIPVESLYMSWKMSPNLSLGQRAEMISTVDLHPCFMKSSRLDDYKCVSFQNSYNSGTVSKAHQVQVIISAEEVGAKDKSPYNSYTYSDIPTSSLSDIIRLRTGNVIFNYRYYNNKLQRTEVTEDFSCPFCLVKCASFKGLRYHLLSSHDLFNYEFWVTEEYQAINVSVKTDIWRTEIVADGVDPKQQTFSFCSKPLGRRGSKSLSHNARHVHPLSLKADLHALVSNLAKANEKKVAKPSLEVRAKEAKIIEIKLSAKNDLLPKDHYWIMDAHSSKGERARVSTGHDSQNAVLGAAMCVERVMSSHNVTGVSGATVQSNGDPECVQSVPASNLAPPAMLQFAKTRKLSIERPDPRNRALLQKRQFFHSHRAQPMAMEQVLSDRDSEDEVDDDVADFEDRRMLDDFVDVTKDEKQLMHLWNSFVRKQRVLADGHIPWACEAFSRLHGHDLAQAPALSWCWRLFLIKLWNHGLLDARTMNNCNKIIEQFKNQETIS